MTTVNQTLCVHSCISGFGQNEHAANRQNAICLSTAALGTLFLISGINDLYRAASSELADYRKQRAKWLLGGNIALTVIALLKIAAGITYICNAFVYEPFKWNSNLLNHCESNCDEISKLQMSSSYGDNSCVKSCNIDCENNLDLPSNGENFGIATGFAVPIGVGEVAKAIYSLTRTIRGNCCQVKNSLVNLKIREWKIANTVLLHDLLGIAYAIAVYILISSDVVGNDKNIYNYDASSTGNLPTSDTLFFRCCSWCGDICGARWPNC